MRRISERHHPREIAARRFIAISPSNPDSGINAGLNVTESVIEVLSPIPPDDLEGISISARDNTLPECSVCIQSLAWFDQSPGFSGVRYQFRDTRDDDPWVEATFLVDTPFLVANVPEPSTFALTAMGLIGVLRFRRPF